MALHTVVCPRLSRTFWEIFNAASVTCGGHGPLSKGSRWKGGNHRCRPTKKIASTCTGNPQPVVFDVCLGLNILVLTGTVAWLRPRQPRRCTPANRTSCKL